MKSPSGSNSLPKHPSASGHSGSSTGSATVPLKVYRELAAELQATKAMLDSLNGHNQQLVQQNQQMRQEVDRLVQSALTLQQLTLMGPANREQPSDAARSQAEAIAAQIRPQRSTPAPSPAVAPFSFEPEDRMAPLVAEQPLSPFDGKMKPSAREINGIWLWLTVIAIILTAFAAGFLLVKPLLPSNR